MEEENDDVFFDENEEFSRKKILKAEENLLENEFSKVFFHLFSKKKLMQKS